MTHPPTKCKFTLWHPFVLPATDSSCERGTLARKCTDRKVLTTRTKQENNMECEEEKKIIVGR